MKPTVNKVHTWRTTSANTISERKDHIATCTTSVHLGSANKFRVWMANGENENNGSVDKTYNKNNEHNYTY